MKYLVPLFFLILSTTLSQTPSEVYEEMVNNYLLGAEEEAIVLASKLISFSEYESVREDAIFFIGSYYYNKISEVTNTDNYVRRASYYLNLLINDYPESQNLTEANQKLTFLREKYFVDLLYLNMRDFIENQEIDVINKVAFINTLLKFYEPNPLNFFFEDDYEGKGTERVFTYIDDIIKNNPGFELIGYYYRILTRLALFKEGILESGIIKLSSNETASLKWDSDDKRATLEREMILADLEYININYPSESITLNLNLNIAKIFMQAAKKLRFNIRESELFQNGKKHLEFIIRNDNYKTGLRYLLVKEYLALNKI